jgi:hypothetical protein
MKIVLGGDSQTVMPGHPTFRNFELAFESLLLQESFIVRSLS